MIFLVWKRSLDFIVVTEGITPLYIYEIWNGNDVQRHQVFEKCSELYQRQGEEQVAGGLGSLCFAVVRCDFCRQNQLEDLHTHIHFY